MDFAEAEQKYRELEDELLSGEISEDVFLARVAQVRVTDQEGRQWMMSGRTGRWLVYDGQQWVFAEPPRERAGFEIEGIKEEPYVETEEEEWAVPVPARIRKTPPPQPTSSRPIVPRLVLAGIGALLFLGCVVGVGVSAWVLVLRDSGEPTQAPTEAVAVGLVETYTPRPATPTYTPTPTPTPTRTPVPTYTSTATNTPVPIATNPPPSPAPTLPATVVSSAAESTPSPTATSVVIVPSPTQVTYTVRPGETLSEIAVRFGVSVQALAEANGITNPALIRAGQVLVIPGPAGTAVASAGGPTPTWTPIVVNTREATATTTATATPTPTSTPTLTPSITPTPSRTPTPRPTNTPTPIPTPTATPRPLSGKIAFTVWNPYLNKYELYVSKMDGSGRNMIGEGFRQPQFRADGNTLAANGEGAPNLEHLVRMNASGGEKIEISNYVEDSYPTWAPNPGDTSVVYSSSAYGDGATRLGIVETLGKNWSWIPTGNTEVRGEYPFWMDNNRIVYHGCDFLGEHTNCGLFLVPVEGGEYRQLTTHSSDTAPSGYGTRVAFMSARDGNWEVYTINLDGSGLRRLTNSGALDGLPTWSPDGLSIAFVSNRTGAWAIWAMNADGSSQRKLFDLGGGYGSGSHDWTTERISWAP
jgi:LysM repeat protein